MTKQCCKCKEFLIETKFNKNKNARDGLQSVCRVCQLKYLKGRNFPIKERPECLKKCSSCGEEKPATLEFFSPGKKNKDGMLNYCKSCNNKKVQNYNQLHKELCIYCNKEKPVCTRHHGQPVCADCRKKQKAEICSSCGRRKSVERRLANGNALCSWCYKKRNLETCSDCKKEKVPNVRLSDGSMRCSECQRRRSVRGLYLIYKRGAVQRDLKFNITQNQFEQIVNQTCHYCGEKANINGHLLGIDRVDNTKGYEKENIVPCCFICNSMKGIFDKDTFLLQVGKIAKRCSLDI